MGASLRVTVWLGEKLVGASPVATLCVSKFDRWGLLFFSLLEVLYVLRAPNRGVHRKLFRRKSMLSFGSLQAPLHIADAHEFDSFADCYRFPSRNPSQWK